MKGGSGGGVGGGGDGDGEEEEVQIRVGWDRCVGEEMSEERCESRRK